MTSANAAVALDDFRRDTLPRVADGLAAAVAASLPWSTSATGVLIALWLVAALAVLDLPSLRTEAFSLPGGLPLLLVLMAMAGLCWGDAPLSERFHGLEPFLRLLMIPVLFAQFRRSDRGMWVGWAVLASAVALLTASFGMVLLNLGDLGHGYGVPVKDYITQSGLFALCGFALFDVAVGRWVERQWIAAAACFVLAALFIADIAYVTTGRTTLVVIPALFLLWGVYHLTPKQLGLFVVAGLVLGAAVWTTSAYVRMRVTGIAAEITEFKETGKETSAGSRLSFWTNSLRVVEEAPVFGHGTGTITEMFRRLAGPEGAATATNPHNQILAVAIQLGIVGAALLLAMWGAHWWLFYQPGLAAWIGLTAVTQNIVSSLFNSHLMDFTQAWIYVFAIGVFGGIVRRKPSDALAAASHAESLPGR